MHAEAPKEKVYIDEELFEQIKEGNQDAFKELYEASYRPLYAFLLSLTQNAHDTQDLMQDTYIQIYKNCGQYKKQGNPMAWIMKVAKNLFLMKLRKDGVRQTDSYEELENVLGTDCIKNVENRILIEKMFEVLTFEERELIILHDVSGLKFKEIAMVLDKPIGTVLTRYNRSIKRLQKEFR